MTRTLMGRTAVVCAILAVALAAIFVVLFTAVRKEQDSSREAQRAAQAVAIANGAEKRLLDVETGSRGFLITGSERFLDPWRTGRRELPAQLGRLYRMESHDPRVRPVIAGIQAAARGYLRDYAEPLVALARRDPRRARGLVSVGDGKRRVDALRDRFRRFLAIEQREAADAARSADADARRATIVAGSGLAAGLLLIGLLLVSLGRFVVRPVRRISAAATRMAEGDLSVRVAERGQDEVGRLKRAFNRMAAALQEGQDELETQNAELEMQTVELEDHQLQITSANDELRAQRDELELTSAQLADEKRLVETLHDFGEQLAAETQARPLARAALDALVQTAGADAGVLYAGPADEDWNLLGAVGVAAVRLPATRPRDDGPAARAIAEGRPVALELEEGGLRVRAGAGEVALRHELHLPLVHGSEALGVVTLAWSVPPRAENDNVETLDHMAVRAATNLAGAFSLEEVQRLAMINRTVVDSVRDGIVLTDREGEVIMANQRVHELTQELFGAALDDVDRGTLIARVRDPDAFTAASQRIDSDPDEPTFDEFEIAESARCFERYTAPVRGSSERIGRIMVIREVTLERQADQAKADLMSTVSHELRTPLASVLGFTELMLTRDPDAERRREYLDAIHTEGRRLQGLIDDFLDLQRVEQGGLPPSMDRVALEEVLREQVDLFSGQSRDHELGLVVEDPPLVVRADRDQLTRVVANLLSNAIKYSPEGGPVKVEARREVGFARVSVTDPGIGIPPDQREHVFEKFFRVDNSDTRKIGGTGLGLALAREIVQLYGGEIAVESVDSGGSRFHFTFPLA
jgi:signal transduction histidine kinase